jgi:hypothetical protein
MLGLGLRLALVVARHYEFELEAVGRGDERRVEDRAGQAVAEESDACWHSH